jgi:hypothetical protein
MEIRILGDKIAVNPLGGRDPASAMLRQSVLQDILKVPHGFDFTCEAPKR